MEAADGRGAGLWDRCGIHGRAGCRDSLWRWGQLRLAENDVDDLDYLFRDLSNGVVDFARVRHLERADIGGCTAGRLHLPAAPGE
jgi:hypothetical protein